MKRLNSEPGGCLRWIAVMLLLFIFIGIAPASAGELPDSMHIYVDVSNELGPRFSDNENGSYYMKFDGGGLNALHLTTDTAVPKGQVTTSNDQSGVFYITDTGGRGYSDDAILMFAVNGTVPDDFALTVRASGYVWEPVAVVNTLPLLEDIGHIDGTMEETFTKEDLLYGPQTWKPAGNNLPKAYPIYFEQDTSDTGNPFQLMFIDLKAGPISKATGLASSSDLTDSGGVKVEYTLENLETFAAFNAYVWCNQSNQGQGISWTNQVSGSGSSVYQVAGIPPGTDLHFRLILRQQRSPRVKDSSSPQPLSTRMIVTMNGITFTWTSSDETVGTVSETGYFTALTAGTTTITAINESIEGEAAVTVIAEPSGPQNLPDYNHIFVKVANNDGVKYNSYLNNTYNIRFAGAGRGLNAHHISTDPISAPFGQVTTTTNQSGVFYITDTGGSGFADNVVIMVAANGTIPDNFRVNIHTSGYNWTPMPGLEEKPPQSAIEYVDGAVDETFTKDDLRYGMLTWKPSGEATPYPIYAGQDMTNSGDTFQYMFVDAYVGQLGKNSGISGLTDNGAVKVEYTIENMPDSVVFNTYCWNSNANQGPSVIAWTNNLIGGHNGDSGYSVLKESSEPSDPQPLPDYNYIFVNMANDDGVKYNAFGNKTYNIRFEGINRGLNALHISTDPAVNFGQVTVSENQSGTFYATDSGGKGYEDEIILMLAVNGTIPDDFSVRVKADGYTWTPNPVSNQPPALESVTYQSTALDEVFTKEDFRYGPQIWKPTGNECDYPIYGGQDLTDTENTFQIMFIDLNAGVLRPNAALENRGAVRINYTFENLETFAAFNVYAYCQTSNNGNDMVAWSNALGLGKVGSGYSVVGAISGPVPDRIEVEPTTAQVVVGDVYHFAATAFDVLNNVISGLTFSWASSNEIVGTIDESGNFTAIAPGTTNVTASGLGITGTSAVTVVASQPQIPLADTPWPKLGGADLNNTGRSPYVGAQTNATKWVYATGGQFLSAVPVIGYNGTVYIGNYDKNVYAFDPDGTLKWTYTAGNSFCGPPALGADGTIYIGNYLDKMVYALNSDGTLKWTYNATEIITGGPTIGSDGTIYIGNHEDTLYALNPDGTKKWSYPCGGISYGIPAIGPDGTIYFGADVNLSALNPDGTLKWSYIIGGAGSTIYGAPVIGPDGSIYVGSNDKNLYAINPDGTLNWAYTTGGAIRNSPVIGTDGTIYFGNDGDKKIYALNPDGTLKWTYLTGGRMRYASPAIGADGTIYIGSADKNFYALNPDGTLKWFYETEGEIRASPSIAPDGTVYIASKDGNVYAFDGVVNVTADTSVGPSPLTVNFQGTSSLTVTAWNWDFGDGTTSTEQNPSHTYVSAGTYTVTLTIMHASGTNYLVQTVTVPATAVSPVANFTADVTSGNAPLSVQFTDLSTNNPATWAWDFEDDGVVDSTGQNPVHTYTAAGTYTVNLTVTNAAGSDSEVKTDYITVSGGSGPDLSRIEVAPVSVVLSLGDGQQFTATAYDDSNAEIANITPVWLSSNETVGTVDASGLLSAHAEGTTTVSAAYGGVTGEASVTVVSAEPATWYVAGDGSADFTTIQAAVDAANAGDTIIVRDGTYQENVDVTKSLLIRSENGSSVTTLYSAAKDSGFDITAGNITLDGFTITAVNGKGNYGIYIHGADGALVTNNTLMNCRECVKIESSSGNTVHNNILSVSNNAANNVFWLADASENSIYLNEFNLGAVTIEGTSTGNVFSSPTEMRYVFNGADYKSYTGNYWNGYTGFDANGDGIGDEAYAISASVIDGYPLMQKLNGYIVNGPAPEGTTYYVDDDGGADFTSIQAAVDAASDGDAIIVCDGTYAESVSVTKGISIRSENGAATTKLAPGSFNGFVVTADGATVEGFTIDKVNGDGNFGVVITQAKDVTIINNTFNVCREGIKLDTAEDAVITGNSVLINNKATNKVLWLINSSNNQIYYNTFTKGTVTVEGISSDNIWSSADSVDYIYSGKGWNSYLGNTWPGYAGTDADGNGIGDTPYTLSDGSTDAYPLVSPVGSYQMGTDESRVTTIIIEPASSLLTQNETCLFTGIAYDQYDSEMAGTVFAWTSSDETVGAINESGFFTALSSGATTITAANSTVEGTASVTVRSAEPMTIIVDASGAGDFTTIQAAIDAALDGDTIVVRDGSYTENLVISKAVTLHSENGPENVTVIAADPAAAVMQVSAANVTLRGLSLSGTTEGSADLGAFGIHLVNANDCIIQENIISKNANGIYVYHSNRNIIDRNTLTGNDQGLYIYGYGGSTAQPHVANYNVVTQNLFTENVASVANNGAVKISYADHTVFTNNTISNNSNYGLILGHPDQTTVAHNEIVSNGGAGIYLEYSYDNTIYYNSIAENGAAFALRKGVGTCDIYLNDITGNSVLIESNDGHEQNWNTLTPVTYLYDEMMHTSLAGNYWGSNYTGTDADGNGIGDEPFVAGVFSSSKSYVDNYPLISPFANYTISDAAVLTAITLDPSEITLQKGQKTAFSAIAFDQYGNEMVGTSFEWASSNTTIGSVNANGIFTAHGAGMTTVTASNGDVSGTATVTVTPPHGDQTEDMPLDVPGCNISENGDGTHDVMVNLTATGATVTGNTIRIDEDTFTLTIETEGAPTVGNGTANGTVTGISLTTAPVSTTFGTLGNVTASLMANLTGIPSGAALETTISENISATAQSAFQIAATADCLNLDAVAYTMNIVKTNLTNGQDIADATIRMSVSPAWVAANGGYDSIKIIRFAEDGTKEVLNTVYLGFDGELDQFEAFSPNGLSIFGLSATSAAAGPSGSSSSSGGSSSSISSARCDGINAGETGVFVMDMTAITEIDVKAGMNIPKMMLTAEKVGKPSTIDAAPNAVYQYIQVTSYLAPEDGMEMATLKFSVDKKWLDSLGAAASDVLMYHYDEATETWNLLSTVACGEDGTCYKFFADTPSFSLFAISAEKGTASAAPEDVSQPAAAESGNTPAAGAQSPADTQTPVTTTGNTTAIVILVVVAIIAVCGVVYWKKTSGKK